MSELKLVEKQYPDWLDIELWQDFIEYRNEIKSPLTPKGEKRALRKLERLIAEGGDQELIIENTIISGKWKGLFQAKPEGEDGKPAKQTKLQRAMSAVQRNNVANATGGNGQNVSQTAQLFPCSGGGSDGG